MTHHTPVPSASNLTTGKYGSPAQAHHRVRRRVRNLWLMLASLLMVFAAWSVMDNSFAQTTRGKGSTPPPPAGVRDATWEELIPADWDPLKDFRHIDLARIKDGDEKAYELMQKLRDIYDRAPTNPKVEGHRVRLPGYIVPIEEVRGEIKEFLLVPYFGACIHTPPPPANQIIHVRLKQPLKGLRTMDAVWASGPLKSFVSNTSMGVSGYRMEALHVERYRGPEPGR